MRTGDFIYVDFVGRVKDTGEVFDLTDEDTAKKIGIHNPKIKYGPVPVIVDGEFILKGLNDALKEMKVGDRKIVELPADKAFGERNPEFVRLIPLSIFKENGVDPIPGRYVTINNVSGRVVSVDGGRVKIDFNHPLAGKKVEYELEIKGEIKDTDEKVRAIVSYYTGVNQDDIEILVKEKEVEIKFKKAIGVPQARKEMIAKTITKWINDLEVVKFVDIYTK